MKAISQVMKLPPFVLVVAVGLYSHETHRAAAQPVCGTVSDCAQKAVEAAQAAQTSALHSIPAGAILAFRLKDCPPGWQPAVDLAGRVIVGAGQGNLDQNNKPLTSRALGQTGGEETHTLTIAEMPTHSHPAQGFSDDNAQVLAGGHGLYNSNRNPTGPAGGNQPHNTMSPYIVLTYCEKK